MTLSVLASLTTLLTRGKGAVSSGMKRDRRLGTGESFSFFLLSATLLRRSSLSLFKLIVNWEVTSFWVEYDRSAVDNADTADGVEFFDPLDPFEFADRSDQKDCCER